MPYDLDTTGLVNPPYAAPDDSLPLRSVKQRLYRGFCASNSLLPDAIAQIQVGRVELTALFEDSTFLSSPAKRGAIHYLDAFFEILEDPKKLKKRILDDCR